VARWNHPDWWIDQLQATYPTQWQDILVANHVPPKIVLRVNRRQSDAQQVVSHLQAAGHACLALSEFTVMLERSAMIEQLPGYHEGWWSIQDWSAQQAVPLLELHDGQRVLDACAAPGGKTAHLLESAHLRLTALDQDPKRLARVAENLSRLKLLSDDVALKAADARVLTQWWDGLPFDVVLADLPCTGSGVVRRHPDIAWLRRPTDLTKTAALQAQLLDALWQTLAPGGQLLLVTCSVFAQEGSEQAHALLQRQPDAQRLAAPGYLLPQAAGPSHPSGQDGFFYALFRRQPKEIR
jgi:16S rRNA (cytosine967-C5)-methyltransferase